MQVAKIEISESEAGRLYREYREHRHYSEPVDDEVRRAYREISRGKMIIRAIDSVREAGLDSKTGLPKLALARADLKKVYLTCRKNGSARMAGQANRYYWPQRNKMPPSDVICFVAHSFNFNLRDAEYDTFAFLPEIPARLKPKQHLERYHILWEVTWDRAPTKDPYLLRRIGHADLWLVVGAWDLTDVERAALATRMAVM